MTSLNVHDLQFALRRLPRKLRVLMQEEEFRGNVFVGGGFLRSVVSGEEISDIDVFSPSPAFGRQLAYLLVKRQFGYQLPLNATQDQTDAFYKRNIYETANALTLTKFNPVIQIIHRWSFSNPLDIINSFDFSVCCAAIGVDSTGKFYGLTHDRFYPDLAAKRLVYLSPKREEEPGGSMLRVLKYYQKGYRMPLDSLAAVIARISLAVEWNKIGKDEERAATIITALLRTVDPLVDLTHEAHLPAESSLINPEPNE